ncbi:MAG TPA: hypothetical protein VH744_02170, partial [Terriglobales bacterium]
MKLEIDNFDGAGVRDYTSAVEASSPARVVRRLNQAAELRFTLVADGAEFVVPANGARVRLERGAGDAVFSGYVTEPPEFEYLGWGEKGPAYRYHVVAHSDEVVLDHKRAPDLPPFVARSAGDALRQLTADLAADVFDVSAVQDLDVLPSYLASPQRKWSEHAAQIALRARASYRAMDGAVAFAPVGSVVHALNEDDEQFCPQGLKLKPRDGVINDITVVGRLEPQAYVKDYFVGDGLNLRFYLSQTPFIRSSRTIFEEEYKDAVLDATRWVETDPAGAISVSSGKLEVTGGTGTDGQTTVMVRERLELGGALVLQHGDVLFSAASRGLLGGLYQ